MVQPKQSKSILETLRSQAESFNKNNPVIATRWLVVETTPGYNTGGYYGVDVPPSNEVVSPYFDSEEDARDWMNNHLPDNGKSLHLCYQEKRRTVTEKWWPLHPVAGKK